MTTKAEKMYALVQDWRKSQQSKADYCRTVPINIHTFTYWVQKYKQGEEETSTPKFIPLTVGAAKPTTSTDLELSYPNGVRLSLNGQPDVELLRALIKITI
jgi:hypothetical protein